MDPNSQPPTPSPTNNVPTFTPSAPIQNVQSPPPQIPPPPLSSQIPPQKPNILKFTLLEIIFVLFLLAIILGTLNFLHIINILPFSHRQPSAVAIVPSLPPAKPTPLPLGKFDLAPLTAYVTNILQPQFLPSESFDSLIASEFNNSLQAHWMQNNTTMILVAQYQPSATSPAMLSLTASSSSSTATLTSPISTASAQTVVNTYFLPFSTNSGWNCTTTQNNSQCEISDKSASALTGYKVILNPSLNQTAASISVEQCTVPAQSSLYTQHNFCFFTPPAQ